MVTNNLPPFVTVWVCGVVISFFYFVFVSSCLVLLFTPPFVVFTPFSLFTCVSLLISPVHLGPSLSVTLCQFICCALSRVWFSPVSFVSFEVLPALQELFVFHVYFLFFCFLPLPFGSLHFDICILYLLGYQLIIKAFLFFFTVTIWVTSYCFYQIWHVHRP